VKSNPKRRQKQWSVDKKIPDEEGNIKFSDLDLAKKEEKVCFSQS
tara:strand:+ start:355 stop:489 length:135 start_codon:yes stop_codon:yes gene_type:complete